MHRRTLMSAHRGVALTTLMVLLATACGAPEDASPVGAPPTSSAVGTPAVPASSVLDPSPSVAPSAGPTAAPSEIPDDIKRAIEKRREYDLRSDLEWVLAVSADPTAIDHWGFYMLPSEESEMLARNAYLSSFTGRITEYSYRHEDEFGGLYLDNAHRQVVTLWTDHADEHLTNLMEGLAADAPIVARTVRWPLKELRRVQRYIAHSWAWFDRIDAEPQAAGTDVSDNVVRIEISSANPDAPRRIARRYARELGVPASMIRVISDGTGVERMPTGIVNVVVVTDDGRRPGPNDLVVDWTPERAGTCALTYLGYGVGNHGRAQFFCTRGWWSAQALVGDPSTIEPFVPVSDPVRVRVRAGRTTSVRIELRPGVNVRFESQR